MVQTSNLKILNFQPCKSSVCKNNIFRERKIKIEVGQSEGARGDSQGVYVISS